MHSIYDVNFKYEISNEIIASISGYISRSYHYPYDNAPKEIIAINRELGGIYQRLLFVNDYDKNVEYQNRLIELLKRVKQIAPQPRIKAGDDISGYTREQFEEKFQAVYDELTLNRSPSNSPKAFLLGGQSGSGKSAIHKIIAAEYPDIIVIDGDRFRARHPNFSLIQEKYGKEAADHSQPFVNEMITSLIDRLSSEKFDLIVEGTCRNVNVPINTRDILKQKGYRVELDIMCEDIQISWRSTINRYNAMEAAGLAPRAVPRIKFLETVKALPDNISQLYKLNIFDEIRLFDRDENCLYKLSEQGASDPGEIFVEKMNEF